MNKLIGLVIVLLFSFTQSSAALQEAETVPDKIEKSFDKKNPKAEKVSWESSEDGQWLVSYQIEETDYQGTYAKNGHWQETRFTIETSEIPLNVNAVLSRKYNNFVITDVDLVITESGNSYDITIDRSGNMTDLVVDSNGYIKEKAKTSPAATIEVN